VYPSIGQLEAGLVPDSDHAHSGPIWPAGCRSDGDPLAPWPEPILDGVTDTVRTAAERRADTLARLDGDADAWVARSPLFAPISQQVDPNRITLSE
jgi:hypothetical protein